MTPARRKRTPKAKPSPGTLIYPGPAPGYCSSCHFAEHKGACTVPACRACGHAHNEPRSVVERCRCACHAAYRIVHLLPAA